MLWLRPWASIKHLHSEKKIAGLEDKLTIHSLALRMLIVLKSYPASSLSLRYSVNTTSASGSFIFVFPKTSSISLEIFHSISSFLLELSSLCCANQFREWSVPSPDLVNMMECKRWQSALIITCWTYFNWAWLFCYKDGGILERLLESTTCKSISFVSWDIIYYNFSFTSPIS